MSEVIARRQFSPGYISLILLCWFLRDCCCGEKKYMTCLDRGVPFGFVTWRWTTAFFHLLTHSRTISEGYSLF